MKPGKDESYVVKIQIELKRFTSVKTPEHQVTKEVRRSRGRPVEVGKAAEVWLKNYLKAGPKRAGDKKSPKPGTVFGDSLANGYKSNTVWRAAEKLGVVKYRDAQTRIYMWTLPESENVAYAIRD